MATTETTAETTVEKGSAEGASELSGVLAASAALLDGVQSGKLELKNGEKGDPAGAMKSGEQKRSVVSSVLSQLEQLIVSEDWAEGGEAKPRKKKATLPKLSELGRSVVTSYSLKAYVGLLGPQHRHNIASWLYSNATATLATAFKFDKASALFHNDELKGGVTELIKVALRHRYPEMAQKGYAAFADSPPVVFLSPALHYDLSQHITMECGIADVVTVEKMEAPLSAIEGRLDQVALEKALEACAGSKTPLMVVAVVGSAFFGQNDLISKLLELREKYGFWLHVVGHGLAALGLQDPPAQLLKVLQSVDSLTLPLGQWLGLQAVPALTLYRAPGEEEPRVSYRDKLEALPWWIALQHLGPQRVASGLATGYKMSQLVLGQLARHKQLQILGVSSSADFAAKVDKGALLPPAVLVFKYTSAHLPPVTDPEDAAAAENAEYLDCLNSWLAQGLIAECPQLGLHLAELGSGVGTGLRYCALESAGACMTAAADVETLGRQVDETLGILDATVEARARLATILADPASPLLGRSVQKWAGVGAVVYVPAMVREGGGGKDPAAWSEKAAQQVAHLNIELVHSLRASDSAFSVGEDRHGLACVKFGMLADHADLEDLVKMVSERGKQIEESAQYMESLADMIRQGIETANEDLRKENDDRLMQEGVMRQVPLVGGFLNWLSPLPKESTNIKGRAFDLKTGRIQSTDVIYKHKLQMEMESGGPLTPVTPIATPLAPHGSGGEPKDEAPARPETADSAAAPAAAE